MMTCASGAALSIGGLLCEACNRVVSVVGKAWVDGGLQTIFHCGVSTIVTVESSVNIIFNMNDTICLLCVPHYAVSWRAGISPVVMNLHCAADCRFMPL